MCEGVRGVRSAQPARPRPPSEFHGSARRLPASADSPRLCAYYFDLEAHSSHLRRETGSRAQAGKKRQLVKDLCPPGLRRASERGRSENSVTPRPKRLWSRREQPVSQSSSPEEVRGRGRRARPTPGEELVGTAGGRQDPCRASGARAAEGERAGARRRPGEQLLPLGPAGVGGEGPGPPTCWVEGGGRDLVCPPQLGRKPRLGPVLARRGSRYPLPQEVPESPPEGRQT